VVAIFGTYLLLGNQIDDLESRITVAQAELDKYEAINKEIAEIKAKLVNLEKKMDVIRKLEASRYEPVTLMDIMTQTVIAKRMWFTKMETRADTVSMSGLAMDDKTVADFMLRLESCGLFSAVSLRNIKQVELQKTALKSFEIVCTKQLVQHAATKGSEPIGAKK
jgi:type IV pilus assembly protein PilN